MKKLLLILSLTFTSILFCSESPSEFILEQECFKREKSGKLFIGLWNNRTDRFIEFHTKISEDGTVGMKDFVEEKDPDCTPEEYSDLLQVYNESKKLYLGEKPLKAENCEFHFDRTDLPSGAPYGVLDLIKSWVISRKPRGTK